ncbi:MAG: HAMP domain-containing protein [Beijerinckiaceae bacterium]
MASASILWKQVNELRALQTDIFHRQYPARLAIVEAKTSEAAFTGLAYQLLHADLEQAHDLSRALREEAKRSRSWMATARDLLAEATSDTRGVSARFDKMLGFLDAFARLQPSAETREFQLEYRFGPLRDDLEAALNHLSNEIGGGVEDSVEHLDADLVRELRTSSAVFAAGYVIFFAGALVWASLALARPILHLAEAMRAITAGQFDVKIGHTGRTDEIGEIARVVEVFRDTRLAVKRLEEKSSAAEAQAQEALVAERERVVEVFREDVMQVIAALSAASTELQHNASMRDMANVTDTRTKSVAASSQDAVQTVETLSSAANELAALLDRMNRDFCAAAQIASRAAEDGNVISERAGELAEAVETIGRSPISSAVSPTKPTFFP